VYSAGGTDLAIRQRQGLVRQSVVIDLCDIADLHTIRAIDGGFEIGAMVTLAELAVSPEIHSWCNIIPEAAASIATPVIRMTATVGGNLLVANRCTYYNQPSSWRAGVGSCLRDLGDTCLATGSLDKCYSRGVSDLAPVFVALDASVVMHDQNGKRHHSLYDLYAPDGKQFHTNLGNDAILSGIILKTHPARYAYRKLRGRQSIDFSSLTGAGVVDDSGTSRICFNGVSPSPVRLSLPSGNLDTGVIQELARRASKTVDNDLIPLTYRRSMIDTLVGEILQELASH
jgi:xanthine dehydrogenase YagS FAD-binding subunit